jgi:hypothetical protein
MDSDLKSFLEKLAARFETRFDAVAKRLDDMDARIEGTEKKLLGEFYKWAPIEVRLRAAEVQTLALLERISLLESRIDKIDGGFVSSKAKMQ